MFFSRDQVTQTLRDFKRKRDNLLHEDESLFAEHLDQFLSLCQKDQILSSIILPVETKFTVDAVEWLKKLNDRNNNAKTFPDDHDEELALRLSIMKAVNNDDGLIFQIGIALGKRKRDEMINIFCTFVVRPLMEEIGQRLEEAVNMTSLEERDLQAVPLSRIPKDNEVKIFLSHKSVDKPLVKNYYNALKEIGYSPWLDEADMPAGSNLERELLRGFQESCAAIFFITRNYKDENYLATEVDYAVSEKRRKGNKFSIITLRYPNSLAVPELLQTYIYKDVKNDLDGFYHICRALPIELGPIRWKESSV